MTTAIFINEDEKISQRGFSLLELVMVVGLMSVVLLGMFSVTAMCQSIFSNTTTYGQLTHNAMQTLRFVSREIGQTSPNDTPSHLQIAADNASVCFQIPVDWDNDGDIVTNAVNPAVEWGSYAEAGQTQGGTLNAWTCYAVNQNRLMRTVTTAGGGVVSQRAVSNNVQTFTVQRVNNDRLQMTLVSQLNDTAGQGGNARGFTSTFTSTTLLRNAVN